MRAKQAVGATFGAFACSALALPASAQSVNPALDPHQGETRLSAALTIPLGQSTDARRNVPRFEIVSQSRTPESMLPTVSRAEKLRWRERRIGFTLDGSDQFLINGRPIAEPEASNNLNTLETVGIVGGAILLGSIVILATNTDDLLPPTE